MVREKTKGRLKDVVHKMSEDFDCGMKHIRAGTKGMGILGERAGETDKEADTLSAQNCKIGGSKGKRIKELLGHYRIWKHRKLTGVAMRNWRKRPRRRPT